LYVIGWLKLKPGKRKEFAPIAKAHQEASQREDGCLFYEWHPSAKDENEMVVIEGWKTAQHHQAHLQSAHQQALVGAVGKYATSGVFEEIKATQVATQRPVFG